MVDKKLKRIVVRTRWEFRQADIVCNTATDARQLRDMINSGATEFSQVAKIVKIYSKTK